MAPRKRQKSNATDKKSLNKEQPPAKAVKVHTTEKELLRKAYGVTYPEDLYEIWNFCSGINKTEPLKALSVLNLQLVGPFEILSKDISPDATNPITLHLRWRFYYDPPELAAIIVSTTPNENPFHIGYYRDDPKDCKCVVVSNSGENCKIEILGDNLFCAVNKQISDKIVKTKGKEKVALRELSKNLQEYAAAHSIDIQACNVVEERRKHIVDLTFHGAGIVVPIDENEVGYRPVGETPAKLKKMFKKIDEAQNDEIRMAAFESVQEIITYVQLANDECDFGMGLELGMQMFCYGSRYLNKAASRMLSMAYQLLKRDLYQKIIEQHLADRKKKLSFFPEQS